ncbi:MAG: hypothetical protein B7Z08_07560 [Sphingomonadales bacterium 32-68-7]|nr:MAG: hypothetical protein B7Z33_01660 [Sphingomonadales bacterium 12-68-11]OYX08827.1 MAG: hypothetical protein B7Z08_07560 [Sphingomonadales bacterium 32-68-7]
MASQDEPDDLYLHAEAAKKLNALYANRLFVQPLGEGLIRLNLGEFHDWEPTYHSASVMTPEMALELATVLHRVALRVMENQLDVAKVQQAARAAAEGGEPDGQEPR